ncbi:helix-turn-helix transcriptional regulator [Streptomyces albiaxialis]|uniref:Helix-turn-helix transcriptional regulator n=1 Tax=Streptomyces albiaxialis TaxID=329523 RepID=A0ABP5H0R5_9ACTN
MATGACTDGTADSTADGTSGRERLPAIVIGTFSLPKGTWFEEHRHKAHQLAWSYSGLLHVRTARGAWLLPPSLALWIPAGVPHATGAAGTAVMRSPYVKPERCPVTWTEPTVVEVTPLLRALIEHLHDDGLDEWARGRAEAVLFDALTPAPVASVSVTRPRDARTRAVADALTADPSDNRTLAEWGSEVGAGARTLARLFVEETGVSFGRWRERLRMQLAVPLLAEGLTVESVAHRVGYGSASAFVAAFRRATGVTPSRWFG